MHKILSLTAKIDRENAKVPEWILLFAAGWQELSDGTRFLVDKTGFDLILAGIKERGNDIVFDYEHASLERQAAPASGWIKELVWQDGKGIMARVQWTDKAAEFIANREYRYFSPVFYVRRSDSRVCGLDSVALTNRPKTNNLTPILARLGESDKKEKSMDREKLIAALGLNKDASDDEILQAVAKLGVTLPDADEKEVIKEVIPEKIKAALDLQQDDDESTVIASIHALKQAGKNNVSKQEFEQLKARLAERDALEAVTAAMEQGKIAPAQKDWAVQYAKDDLKGFNTFVARAPVVVPMDSLPRGKEKHNDGRLTETDLKVAGMMGVDEEDLKKYGMEVKHG